MEELQDYRENQTSNFDSLKHASGCSEQCKTLANTVSSIQSNVSGCQERLHRFDLQMIDVTSDVNAVSQMIYQMNTTQYHLIEDLEENIKALDLINATSIIIQRETGGNLAEVLEKISGVLRARFRFHRRVRTLTAEGRISAWAKRAGGLAGNVSGMAFKR